MAIFKGYLKLLVLKSLDEEDRTGYGLCKKINEKTGWKPSYGSMYPLLDNFHEKGLVDIKKEGKKKIYSLTEKGKDKLKEVLEKKQEMFDRIIEAMKMFGMVSESKEFKRLIPLIEYMKKNKFPFFKFQPHLMELKMNMFEILKSEDKEKLEKVEKLIKKTNKQLEKIKNA